MFDRLIYIFALLRPPFLLEVLVEETRNLNVRATTKLVPEPSCNNLSVCSEPSWVAELYVLGVAPKDASTLGGGVTRDVDLTTNSTCFHISMSDACRKTACTKGRNKAIARFSSSIRAYIEASSRSTVPLDSRERSFFATR